MDRRTLYNQFLQQFPIERKNIEILIEIIRSAIGLEQRQTKNRTYSIPPNYSYEDFILGYKPDMEGRFELEHVLYL